MELDWSTAEVRDGKLRVTLDEKPSREWGATFERTAHLLGRGAWSQVKLKGGQIVVEEVEPGSEERLRFFLEGVVQEANAGEAPDEPEEDTPQEEAGEQDEAGEDGDEEPEPDPDEEMTERFRSFGGSD